MTDQRSVEKMFGNKSSLSRWATIPAFGGAEDNLEEFQTRL
jgi:hypothetical protein